ncbi:MAG: hypothetical protein HC875_33005 [Anaerolineales bacterium]|nr:hypothetical protein [Anaerolineales bacterium]
MNLILPWPRYALLRLIILLPDWAWPALTATLTRLALAAALKNINPGGQIGRA